ncbi:MAG: arsenate reductase (azurin) small subunit [Betaproteobacteria bacterium]
MKDDEHAFPLNGFPVTRRAFIRIGCTTISGSLVAGMAPALAAAGVQSAQGDNYPTVDVAALATINVDMPVPFTYPDANSPAVLLRLRQPAPGGVGPNDTIVAYSALCTHKGCPVAYRPERKLLICPCHWSSFDPGKAGQMVIGQGSQALPQIVLRVNGTMVQATGITGLIYGRETNIL